MRIAVLGGTGLTGTKVIERLVRLGHTPIAVSRSGSPVDGAVAVDADTVVGTGLDEAFADVQVVIDCRNTKNPLDTRVFTIGTRNAVAAAEEAGVARVVVVSIVGIDDTDFAYYNRKLDQERAWESGPFSTTIVRSTQYHEYSVQFFEAGAAVGVIPVMLGGRLQPVDVGEVADVLVEQALQPTGPAQVLIGGPEVRISRDLAKAWQQHTRARGVIVNGPFPPSMLRYVREGKSLVPDHRVGRITFEEWLSRNR